MGGAVPSPLRNCTARRLAIVDAAPLGYNPTQSNALPDPFVIVTVTFWPANAVVGVTVMFGAFTVTLTAVDVALDAPLSAVSVKLRVTEPAPWARIGAVNVVTACVFVNVTADPAVCFQRYVSVRAGLFGSVPAPVSVTVERDPTL